MQLLKKIKELKKSIQETDELVEQLISSLRAEEIRSEKKENKILQLKDEINLNIKKSPYNKLQGP